MPDIAAAIGLVAPQLRAGDVVLVKASRAAGLERLADALQKAPTDAPERRSTDDVESSGDRVEVDQAAAAANDQAASAVVNEVPTRPGGGTSA